VQFRELEFALGLKDGDIHARLSSTPEETDRLRARLAAPSLGEDFDDLLVRRGFPRQPEPAKAPGGRAQPEEWRLEALVRIYEDPDAYPDLLALAEVMVEVDECLALWRAHHVQMVERMIGAKRGTGGSEGVAYLQSTLPKRAFPDLWRVRTRIGQEPA
jgi:tryptophan 2,3-dioxygenase